MVEMLKELFTHTLQDTILSLPLLFITYYLLERIERKNCFALSDKLSRLKNFAPLCGALLGLLPQCGFSVIAAGLYVDGVISLGTLAAVFIATSDEAMPVLLAHPDRAYLLIYILITKFLFAALLGYLVDLFVHKRSQQHSVKHDAVCGCHHHDRSVFTDALMRTVKIYSFLFIISFLLTWLIHEIGEQRLASLLLERSIFQPLLALFVGFIPNCAASVILTQLFADGVLSFGSLIAGLSVNAGLGFMVLLKAAHNKKDFWLLLIVMFVSAFALGTLLHVFL